MRKALLVDDEAFAIEALQLFVDWAGFGFEICGTCENGEDAYEAIVRLKPDVVFTDIRMPVLDGTQLIERVRESGSHPNVQFVILSGYGEFAYAQSALRLGVRHYLLKPIMTEEASEVLEEIVKQMSARADDDTGTDVVFAAPPALHPDLETSLLEAIEMNDVARVQVETARLGEWTQESRFEAEAIVPVLDHLVSRCLLAVKEMDGDQEELRQAWALEAKSDTEAEALIAAFVRFADAAMMKIHAIRKARCCHPADEAERYIRQHYRESITVGELAERFYMNAAYLGQVFQARMGKGVLVYVHDLRIEEACCLMRANPSLTMTEIAERVGYVHYHHFLKQYEKRHQGRPSRMSTPKTGG